MAAALDIWLDRLGYAATPERIRRARVSPTHPYASEIGGLLDPVNPRGPLDAVRAAAVFEVDGVPAVCFIEGDPAHIEPDALRALQRRAWNQGLISVILLVGPDALRALPAVPNAKPGPLLRLEDAGPDSPYSAVGVASAGLIEAHPDWFRPRARVDQQLIDQLGQAVKQLEPLVGGLLNAQHLMGQVLFISYLEHRGIVQDRFRDYYGVGTLGALARERDGAGIDALITQLHQQFNGDFLRPEGRFSWSGMPEAGYVVLDKFLARTALDSGQQSFWGYDFRYIPVELLSGIYESFIGDKASELGAYYTPRHLANLAVDQVLDGLPEDELPVIYDGACGSGILLTTAFRRVLGRAEARAGRQLLLRERGDLLKRTIYGGDLSEAACTVTAFSLYLALLEDLVPTDVTALTQDGHDRLPSLTGLNIFAGEAGDMFALDGVHPATTGKMPRPTIVLSNPPWGEPGASKRPSYEAWLASVGREVPLRQIAIAFAMRATALAAPGARLCLIMPAPAFLKQQSQPFLRSWLDEVTLRRLINLSDMRSLLFRASHACVVALAEVTPPQRGVNEPPVLFDYLTPKADIGLASGRLTVHASDRKVLSQRRVQTDPTALRTLYWGSEYEAGQLERLCGRGQLRDLVRAGRFVAAKGFHVTDGSKQVALEPLQAMPFLDAKKHPKHGPVLPAEALHPFSLKKAAAHGDFLLYAGARVVFTDGMTPTRRVRACYADTPFSFTNSIGAIRDLEDDAALMRFLAVYLCSDVAAYFALLSAPTAVLERTQIKLAEVLNLPFWLPERHPDPPAAQQIVERVDTWMRQASAAGFELQAPGTSLPGEIEALIRTYFLLDPVLVGIVDETALRVLGAVQPATLTGFPTALQRLPAPDQLEDYATALSVELERYRMQAGGVGELTARVDRWQEGGAGYGIVIATAGPLDPATANVVAEAAPLLLRRLRDHGVLAAEQAGFSASSDVLVRFGNAIVFAKPLISRLWLRAAALDDALRIVRSATLGAAA